MASYLATPRRVRGRP